MSFDYKPLNFIRWAYPLDRLASNDTDNNSDAESQCTPFLHGNDWGSNFSCEFVQQNAEVCEGGGYVLWTKLITCEVDDFERVILIVLAVFALLYLFLMISTSANDFFSKNIANIVDEHSISQSTAGVTFMAFGNGAPDIFSSIASMSSTTRPNANLAVAELLGGGIFVTTVVIASIIFVKPFKVAGLPFLRDAAFYLLALGWLTFIMLFDNKLHIWQAIFFIVLYLIYVATVLLTRLYYNRTKRTQEQQRKITIASLKVAELNIDFSQPENAPNDFLKPPEIISPSQNQMEREPPSSTSSVFPVVKCGSYIYKNSDCSETSTIQTDSIIKRNNVLRTESNAGYKLSTIEHNWELPTCRRSRNSSTVSGPKQSVANAIIVPQIVLDLTEDESAAQLCYEGPYLESGKFFMDPDITDNEEIEGSEIQSMTSKTPALQHERLTSITRTLSRSGTQSMVENLPLRKGFYREVNQTLKYLNPLDVEEFKAGTYFEKLLLIIKMPCVLVFKLTIPVALHSWLKLLVMLYLVTAPMTMLFAFQIYSLQVFTEHLQLWMIVLATSLVAVVLVALFTSQHNPPPYARKVISYFGFATSAAWIYLIATEIVDIVLMLGVIYKISFNILGLTLIAWSNSLGDLVADYSVAKQGYSKMAMGAAIGGPLFNLMIGLGISSLTAQLQRKSVPIKIDAVLATMLISLGVSLTASIVILVAQRFQARRFHSLVLIAIYFVFVVVVVLKEIDVLF